VKGCIRLRMVDGDNQEQVWESANRLRIGRQDELEIVLDDGSVSRQHAEIYASNHGWRVKDLRSTNGTTLNGKRLGQADWPLSVHDIVKCGNVTFVVDNLQDSRRADNSGSDELVVEATSSCRWEDALHNLAYDRNRCPRPGEQMLALLRAGHHLGHLENVKELLDSILNDAVSALDAQRGAIVLADGPNDTLQLRALASADRAVACRPGFSQSLAQRSFTQGESTLCRSVSEDPELAMARSIADGAMASVLCVLLRTPRRKLGVLHLDRGPFQKPFSRDDLHLADALAANVSAGIESAQLLQRQQELFLNTITILAQAIDLRDDYTGGHTARVTRYSELLGKQMNIDSGEMKWLRFGTPLHDIGKIGINDAILLKPGALTAEEYKTMQTHTVKGAEILATIPDLKPVIPIVRSHHERWDGRGYPDNLLGEDIPRLARIVAVADTFDAMTSDRPYRKGMPAQVAFAEVEKQSGKQFDPECAGSFLAIRDQIIAEKEPGVLNIAALAEALSPVGIRSA
jgi:HD-GYP domain-containing protein (c-di-GMP phosphodiesterase class II)/pSer/pThr/pTyr-binding forkhead associated (FHA) protein